jgi:glycosyltransferase involved in cell wall biosynthesis
MRDLSLSVVVPVFNEAESLAELDARLRAVLDRIGEPAEIILVDDGSRDGSWQRMVAIGQADPRYRMVRLRRNYGQSAALAAGIDLAHGEFVVLMDADLQNDPDDIPRLLDTVRQGFDLVSGWRKDRHDAYVTRRLPSEIANRIIARVTGVALHDVGCTLKIYRSEYIKDVQIYGEMHRLLPALVKQAGGTITEVVVNHHPRRYGTSKYGINRTLKVMLDLITVQFLGDFGSKPIYIFGGAGAASIAAALLTLAYIVFDKVVFAKSLIESPLLLLSVMSFLVGVQFVVIGLVAELIVRVWHESQGKDPYRITTVVETTTPSPVVSGDKAGGSPVHT